MEVQRQLQVLADELNMVKNELVGMKSDHSALHNVAVETDRTMRTKLEQMETIEHQKHLRDQFMKENSALKDKILKIE